MGMKKVNIAAYHLQVDGLVERFNRTLLDMLSKTAKQNGKDWDSCFSFVLYAYQTSPQTSTGEYLYLSLSTAWKRSKVPTEAILCPPSSLSIQI